MYQYALYGTSLRSEWPLPYPDSRHTDLPIIELLERPGAYFVSAASEADRQAAELSAQYVPLSDGTEYLRWTGLFEFLISADGRRIAGRPLSEATSELFHTYLLGQRRPVDEKLAVGRRQQSHQQVREGALTGS